MREANTNSNADSFFNNHAKSERNVIGKKEDLVYLENQGSGMGYREMNDQGYENVIVKKSFFRKKNGEANDKAASFFPL